MDIHNVEDSVDEKSEKKVLNFHQMELDDRILKVSRVKFSEIKILF